MMIASGTAVSPGPEMAHRLLPDQRGRVPHGYALRGVSRIFPQDVVAGPRWRDPAMALVEDHVVVRRAAAGGRSSLAASTSKVEVSALATAG